MRSTFAFLTIGALGMVLLARCGNGPKTFDTDSGTTDDGGPAYEDVSLPPIDSPTNPCGTDVSCSGDMHSILDCNGNVIQTCADTEGCAGGKCIPACDAAIANKSAVGCEYYAHNPHMIFGNGCFAIYVANTWNAPVSVTGYNGTKSIDLGKYAYLPKGSGTTLSFTALGAGGKIPPGQVGIVFLNDGYVACPKAVAQTDANASGWNDPQTGTHKNALALRVVASAPVVVYDIMPFGGGKSEVTDATLLLPTSTWGKNYVAVTPRPLGNNTLQPSIAIVAAEDNTTVTFRPSVVLTGGNGIPAGSPSSPVTFTLNKGQVAKMQQDLDLLGSIVSTDKPVGVWGEQDCINIDAYACDGSHEQIPPVAALGSEYVYVRYRNRQDGVDETPPTRIVGLVDGTTLTWEPSMPTGGKTTVKEGETFEVRSSTPFVVKSQDDKHPFYVGTYMTGGAAFQNRGDPEFVNVVPAQQYLTRYVFFTDPTYPETNLVLIRKKAKDNTFKDVNLDCGGTISGWKAVGTSGIYEWVHRDLVRHNFQGQSGCDNGAHEAKSDGPFSVTVWGWGTSESGGSGTSDVGYSQYVSYAYPAGASVQSINTVIIPPTPK